MGDAIGTKVGLLLPADDGHSPVLDGERLAVLAVRVGLPETGRAEPVLELRRREHPHREAKCPLGAAADDRPLITRPARLRVEPTPVDHPVLAALGDALRLPPAE